jgi:ABC-type dipeptide/oligopeptide/nickel transport system permease component
LHILPGDFAEVLLMQQMDGDIPEPEALEKFKSQNGFDEMLPVQYLYWLKNAAGGDLGISFQSDDPVIEELTVRLPNTLQLAMTSILVSLVIALPLGIAAAFWSGTLIDKIIMAFAVVGLATPNFWLALLGMLLFSLVLGWLPVSGFGTWAHLVLPSLVIGSSLAGVTARLVRSAMLEVLSQPFIRTAYAKGLSQQRVLIVHALPNILVSTVTLVGLQLAKMFDSLVVVETVFGWPGIGRLFVESILGRDFPVIQGCVLVIGLVYLVLNLFIDLCVQRIDPRIQEVL